MISKDTYYNIKSGDYSVPIVTNIFIYCNNNPISLIDVTGKYVIDNLISLLLGRLVFGIRLRQYCNPMITKEGKAGKISIDIAEITLCDTIYKGIIEFGKNVVYDIITDVALDAFYNYYWSCKNPTVSRRVPLFSDACIRNEIALHIEGYLGASGYKDISIPGMFTTYSFTKAIKKENRMKIIMDACKYIDIKEEDCEGSLKQKIGFDYFQGIRDCYKYTRADPYYNINKDKRVNNIVGSVANPNWHLYIDDHKYTDH